MKRRAVWIVGMLVCVGLCACREMGGEQAALKEPPALKLACQEETIAPALGSYLWNYEKTGGQWETVTADSVSPFDSTAQMLLPRLEGWGTVSLQSPEGREPDQVLVQAWPDSSGRAWHGEAQEVPWEEGGFELLEGSRLYTVLCTWTSREAWNGQAYYYFLGEGISPEPETRQVDDGTVVEHPPVLEVSTGERETTAAMGSFEWTCEAEESGTVTGGSGDFRDPLADKDVLPRLEGSGTVSLSWDSPTPDTLSVTAVSSEEEREVPVEGTAFSLLEGEWVYQVTAEWTSRSRWGGSVQYAFLGVS